ncbi:MAG: hypothetical protein AAF438_20195 [Pseudomonadota bacterium]
MLLVMVCLAVEEVSAREDQEEERILRGLQSSFALPFSDLFIKEHESEWDNLTHGLSMSLSTNYPLDQTVTVSGQDGSGTEGTRSGSSITSSVAFKYTPLKNWYASVAFVKYWDADLQAPWNPDFTYTFGYSDWRPYTLSLGYANYGGNRLNPDKSKGEVHTNFDQGAWTLGWKFPIPKSQARPFMFHEDGSIGCNVSYSLVPSYFDLAASGQRDNKRSLGLSCRYTIYGYWFFSINFKHYLKKPQQQPWDPDYTYGFGYFDWHPGTIVFQYANYAANKFDGSTRLKDGSISISWSYVF